MLMHIYHISGNDVPPRGNNSDRLLGSGSELAHELQQRVVHLLGRLVHRHLEGGDDETDDLQSLHSAAQRATAG